MIRTLFYDFTNGDHICLKKKIRKAVCIGLVFWVENNLLFGYKKNRT